MKTKGEAENSTRKGGNKKKYCNVDQNKNEAIQPPLGIPVLSLPTPNTSSSSHHIHP
jgi:hypothetical protein